MYDFWLGGKDHFAVDRAAALEVSEAAPEVRMIAAENRKFLRRSVRYLATQAGITQFLDIGTGLPTQGNVHQVAQQVNPAARVAYADNDPMVLAHSRALKTSGNTAVIEADLRDPATILDHPRTRNALASMGRAGSSVCRTTPSRSITVRSGVRCTACRGWSPATASPTGWPGRSARILQRTRAA
jgi:hypothetical protein